MLLTTTYRISDMVFERNPEKITSYVMEQVQLDLMKKAFETFFDLDVDVSRELFSSDVIVTCSLKPKFTHTIVPPPIPLFTECCPGCSKKQQERVSTSVKRIVEVGGTRKYKLYEEEQTWHGSQVKSVLREEKENDGVS